MSGYRLVGQYLVDTWVKEAKSQGMSESKVNAFVVDKLIALNYWEVAEQFLEDCAAAGVPVFP